MTVTGTQLSCCHLPGVTEGGQEADFELFKETATFCCEHCNSSSMCSEHVEPLENYSAFVRTGKKGLAGWSRAWVRGGLKKCKAVKSSVYGFDKLAGRRSMVQ